MSHTIGGVVFSIVRRQNGGACVSVVAKSNESWAVEFIVESTDGEWASVVSAVRSGVSVIIPDKIGRRIFRVRLFNDVGKEIDANPDNLIEVVTSLDHSLNRPSTQSGRKLNGLIFFAVLFCWGVISLRSSLFTDFASPSAITSSHKPSLAILSKSANLRSAPALAKNNIITILPFGTQLFEIAKSGEFVEVQVFGGAKGFVHKVVAGDANRVQILGLKDSLHQAQAISDDRRVFILGAVQALQTGSLNSSLFERSDWRKVEAQFQAAVLRTSGDDVAGRFFHFLAEDSVARGNFNHAVLYYRAAALSNPLSVTDVHGWGVTQLRLEGTIDETAALHATVVSPRSTNTWLMVAGHLAGQQGETSQKEVVSALLLAISFSSDRRVTKRFFQDLSQATSNAVLKSALAEAAK